MDEEEIKRTARKDFYTYFNIDDVVVALSDYRANGENVAITFNGETFYSLLDDEDSCYMRFTGETKEEIKKYQEEVEGIWSEYEIKRELESLKKIPGWIERGDAIMYPQQKNEWEKVVREGSRDTYHGSYFDNALDIMESLAKEGDLKKAYELYENPGHTGAAGSKVVNLIMNFSEMGTLFYRYACLKQGVELGKEDKAMLRKIDEKFDAYQAELGGVDNEKDE